MPIRRSTLLFAMLFPTLITWVYFVWLDGSEAWLQQGSYTVGKLIQFGFPLLIIFALRKEPRPEMRWNSKGVGVGIALGVAIFIAMLTLYFLWLEPSEAGLALAEKVRTKVGNMGLSAPAAYIALALFYSFCHSGLEEYYWRWFVFKRILVHGRFFTAVWLSSLGFMAHHILLLGFFFDDNLWLSCLFSLGVGIGGVIWAILYHKTKNIFAVWTSHAIVDMAIFFIGYDILFLS